MTEPRANLKLGFEFEPGDPDDGDDECHVCGATLPGGEPYASGPFDEGQNRWPHCLRCSALPPLADRPARDMTVRQRMAMEFAKAAIASPRPITKGTVEGFAIETADVLIARLESGDNSNQ